MYYNMIYTTLAHWETRNNAAQRHRKCAEDARSAIAGPSPNNEAATPGGIKSRQRNAKQQEREDGAPQAVAEVSIQGAECLQTSAASRGHEQDQAVRFADNKAPGIDFKRCSTPSLRKRNGCTGHACGPCACSRKPKRCVILTYTMLIRTSYLSLSFPSHWFVDR